MESVGYLGDVDVATYVEQGGEHSETYWGPRFHYPMEFFTQLDAFQSYPISLQLNSYNEDVE